LVSKLKDTLKGVKNPHKARPPLWQGPESNDANGGITFSMLSRFIVCRERFRVHYMEGWRPAPSFNPRMEYGNMWHVCEEALSQEGDWLNKLGVYTSKLLNKYPYDQDCIRNWWGICKVQFPIYVEYWSEKGTNPKGRTVTPLLQEQVFNVPYTLPSGRTVKLRGKWDEVVLIKDASGSGIWVGDHKTKSQIDGLAVSRQLTNDLQSMLYLVAIQQSCKLCNTGEGQDWIREAGLEHELLMHPLRGMRYNVIKRPGQYQGKKESAQQFQQRLDGIIRKKPDEFFARWETVFSPENIARFRKRTLDPLLENLCNWYRFLTNIPSKPEWELLGLHWQTPFGVYNPLLEGGATDLDAYLVEGSTVGLERSESLFEELK
jgi:hypothetical protein